MDVTVCVPTIPPRGPLLARAVASILLQTQLPSAIAIAYDFDHKGHGLARNDAIAMAQTEWLAFLDDDDEFYPEHLEKLVAAQAETGADVVYPWYDVIGGADPWPMHKFVPWDPEKPHLWAMSCLVRKQVLLDVGGFVGYDAEWNDHSGQDWSTWRRVIEAGVSIYHLPEVTWAYHHDSGNTSGRGDRW